mmetsp:Transcript_17737/g.30035  ORF Transcript_17737/g.30035 Transcript_17737/m.30035 type:complete len:129 (+) Transcript_17737:1209-1595(+)
MNNWVQRGGAADINYGLLRSQRELDYRNTFETNELLRDFSQYSLYKSKMVDQSNSIMLKDNPTPSGLKENSDYPLGRSEIRGNEAKMKINVTESLGNLMDNFQSQIEEQGSSVNGGGMGASAQEFNFS